MLRHTLKLILSGLFATAVFSATNDKKPADFRPKDQAPITVFAPSAGRKPYAIPGTAFSLFTYSNAVFGLPIQMTSAYELKPGFIKDWYWDYKENKYRLSIDSHQRFHNGRAITSRDVEFMLLKSYFMQEDLQDKKWLINLRGSSSLKDKKGAKFQSGLIEGIKIIDERTLDIYLENENPLFLYNLTRSIPPLVPIEEMQDDYQHFKKYPVGAGNYQVIFDDPASSLVRLQRVAPDNGAPQRVDIVGDCDFVHCHPDVILGQLSSIGVKSSHEYRSVESPLAVAVSNIFFNFQNPAGASKDFRKMIHLLVDRGQLNQGDPVRSPLFQLLPAHFWGRLHLSNPFNKAEAQDIQAGLPENLRHRQHIVKYYGLVDNPPYIQSLRAQMKDFGLNVEFVRSKDIKIEKDEDISMLIVGMSVDFQDPLNVFSYFLSDGARPYQHPPHNRDFDDLFERAIKAKNKIQQAEFIQLLSRKVLDEVYCVPLFEARMQYHIGPRIDTIGQQNFGPHLDLEEVRLK